jgi:hypothetical protein
MDPPELASEPAPCYARRGRIEPPGCRYNAGIGRLVYAENLPKRRSHH